MSKGGALGGNGAGMSGSWFQVLLAPPNDSLQSCRRHYGNVGKFCKQGGGGETSVVAVQAVFELECLRMCSSRGGLNPLNIQMIHNTLVQQMEQ